MKRYYPEGQLLRTQTNRAAQSGVSSLKDAMAQQTVLEAVAEKCGREHDLTVGLGCMKGIIPREEGAVGIGDGTVRDIALISRVGKPVCFVVTDILKGEDGRPYALLSRKKAQERCMKEYLDTLLPGDVIPAKVTRMESFGVFCDIGAGISALLPIDAVSVSRIPHPSARFTTGQEIRAVVSAVDRDGRITLSHKELLGTWQENAETFSVGETVPGVVRTVESYGIFVELTPNLAGLAEYDSGVKEGEYAAVYIKNIIPERMKIKLVIVDHYEAAPEKREEKYFFTGEHMNSFRYSPECCPRNTETVF